MLITFSELKNYVLNAEDGEIGRVRDLLFDDDFWTVRYFDVNTSKWFLGRRVLVSPISVEQPNTDSHRVDVALTKQRVKDSPSIEHDAPISQQYTRTYNIHFGYPHYWVGQDAWGMTPYPSNLRPPVNVQETKALKEAEEKIEHSHLRSIHEVNGYTVQGADDEIGMVSDFILDTDTWKIRYLVLDIRRVLPGPSVLLAVNWVDDIIWHDHSVHVNVKKNAIETAPHFDGTITRNEEIATYKHYGRKPYWLEKQENLSAKDFRLSTA